jgi:hypothetical protein
MTSLRESRLAPDSRRLMRTVVDMAVLAAVEALFETRLLKEPAE